MSTASNSLGGVEESVGEIGKRIMGTPNVGSVTEGGVVDHQFIVKAGRGVRMQNDLNGLVLGRRWWRNDRIRRLGSNSGISCWSAS